MGFDGFYVAAVMVVNGSIWMYAEIIVANSEPPSCAAFISFSSSHA